MRKVSILAAAVAVGTSFVSLAEVPDTFVEYIGTSHANIYAGPYIDTGIAPNPRKTRMVVKLAPTVVDNTQVAFFGSGNSWGNNVCNFILLNGGQFRLDWIGSQTKTFTPNVGQIYTFDCCNNVVSIDGQKWSNQTATWKTDADYPDRTILLFDAWNGTGKVGGARMRLYDCRIYQDGVALSANLIPCVKDGVPGVYNTVTDEILYDLAGKGFERSAVERTDYRVFDGEAQTTLTLTKPSEGGTCYEDELRWVAMNSEITLSALPDVGMAAAWSVTDMDGVSTQYYGNEVTIKMPATPSTVSLVFYPEDAVATVEQLRLALDAAEDGETIRLAPGEFELDSEILIDKPITLEGAGRELTILKPVAAGGEFRAINMTAAATVRNLKITGFKANVDGLGVYMTKGTLDNVWVYGNTMYCTAGSLKWGAGVYVYGADCVVTNCTIEKCFADRNYGNIKGIGIQLKGGTVVDSEILNNERERTEFYGGGVHISAKDSYLIRCLIKGNGSRGKGVNTSNTLGMGVYMESEGVIDSCRIIGNDIQGVWLSKGVMKNCLVTGHKSTAASYTAGVQMSGTAKMYNCTIWGNEAANAFAGLQMTGGTAVNNIIWHNGTIANASVGDGTFNTNVVDTASAVTTAKAAGNINSDPWMTDPENGDFTLTFESPALDAAASLEEVAVDLLGTERPQGVAPDIGAFESVMAGGDLMCAIIVPVVDWKEGTAVSVMCRASGGTGNYSYTWYVDGVEQVGLDTSTPTFEGLDLGKHTLALEVSDGFDIASQETTDAIVMHPTTVYVAADGDNVYPYNTPENAATSVNDAFDALWKAAGETSTMYVGEGDFDVTATLTLNTPCRLIGAGRDETRLHGGKLGAFRALEIAHADAVAKDFTIDGCTNKVKGVAISLSNGWLENVRSTRNWQENEPGSNALPGGAGLAISGGTATNCLFDANFGNAGWGYSTGIALRLEGGTVVDCDIRDNWMKRNQQQGIGAYVTGGELLASRIVNNYSTVNTGDSHGDGLCVEGGTVDRCEIVSNGWTGVYLTKGTIKNSLVFGHHGEKNIYAGVSMPSGTGKLLNCTVVGNVADSATDGRSGLQMAAGTAVNNIIYGNGSVGSCAISGGTFNTNIIGNAVAIGVGNIEADPKFRDAEAGDFHIKSGSTAIDSGAELTEVDVDLDGVARPQKDGWDVGCYEYVPGGERTLSISAPQTKYPVGGTIAATVAQEGLDVAGATFTWTLTRAGVTVDSQVILGEEGQFYAYETSLFGTYTLTLSATDGAGTLAADNAETFTVSPLEVFVSNEGSGEFPYDAPEKATSDFCAAVNALWQDVGSTTTVHVAAGEFAMTGPVTLGMPVRVQGAGRDVTVLNAAALPLTQRAFTMTHADAVLADLGVTGATNTLAGSGVNMTAGTLRGVRIFDNCTKISSAASQAIPGGVGLRMSGGLATNCFIEANVAKAVYGLSSGVGLYLTDGLVVDCVIRDNRIDRNEVCGVGVYMAGGVLRRCRIEGNSTCGHAEGDVKGVGLGTFSDTVTTEGSALTVEDCVIVGNGVQGVYVGAKRAKLVNVLIADHATTTTHFPAGASLLYGSYINCTFAGNTSPEGSVSDLEMSAGTLINSIAPSANVAAKVTQSCNCLNEPVAFKRGYQLKASDTNCIDVGDNSVWQDVENPTDISGEIRIRNGVVDLGCFEYVPVGFSVFVR